jgi:CRP-like cAMP-binding protein
MAETLERLLAAHPFFAGLPEGDLHLLAECATNARFRAGERLFRQGDAADRFFVVREGRVALELALPGRGAVALQTVEAGQVLGWSWLIPPHEFRYSARALEDVRALCLDGACLRGKCERDPRLGFALLRRFSEMLSQRLEATLLQLVDVYRDREGAHSG